jgi:outer membrane protein assembly factor BamB
VGEDNEKIGTRLFHGQWSSPSVGYIDNEPLIFFGAGDGICYAFEKNSKKESDGDFLVARWKFDCNPPEYKTRNGKPIKYPDPDGPSEINATPVFYNNKVYVAIGQDPEHGEGVGRLLCIDASLKGDITKTGLVWDYRGIHRSISTVSIDPKTDLLFVADFSGYIHCLDAKTGKVHWVHDAQAHIWGSTLLVDGKVYIGDEEGDLMIFEASPVKKVLHEVNLNAPVYSSPVVANGTLYVASQSHLFAFKQESKPLASTP